MAVLFEILALIIHFTRTVLLWGALVAAVIVFVDWCVRTRRISPFGKVARVFRSAVDPLVAPIERRVVRGGGLPSHAPWWALAVVVVGGILLLTVLGYIRDLVGDLAMATAAGPSQIARVLVMWTFGLLELALLIRVASQWIRISPYSKWVRWTYSLTEWLLRPLRQVVPPLGMLDVTPIVAYFVLVLLGQAVQRLIV